MAGRKYRVPAIVFLFAGIGASLLWLAYRDPEIAAAGQHVPDTAPLAAERVPTKPPERESSPKAAGVTKAAVVRRSRTDWSAHARKPGDYLKFVIEAAAAAEQGDDGAAHAVSEVLFRCGPQIQSIRRGVSREKYLSFYYSHSVDPAYADHIAQLYDSCAPLATAAELAQWADEPGGKFRMRYWRDLALKLGNPAVQMESLVSEIMTAKTPEQRRQIREAARAKVSSVIRSQDPEGWYQLGMGIAGTGLQKDPAPGFALALASCDLGYDCSGNVQSDAHFPCRGLQGCTDGLDLNQQLQLSMPPDVYARAYSRSQELANLIREGAWSDIDAYVPLDGAIFERNLFPPD